MINQLMRSTMRDTAKVCLACTRNSLALVGFSALLAIAVAISRGPFAAIEENPLTPTVAGNESGGFVTALFLRARVPAIESADRDATNAGSFYDHEGRREVVVSTQGLSPAAQIGIARYLARKYHLSSDAMSLMVREADATGREAGLDPMLLLAVIGVESGFNPFAESGVGAQGLMQVMSNVHRDKFDEFGGAHAALDPVANIKIGAFILKDCIRRGGSLRDGLRLYVGSTTEDDGGYGMRVFQEKDRIQLAARGGNPLIIPVLATPAKATPPNTPAKTAQAHETPAPSAEAASLPQARDKMAAL